MLIQAKLKQKSACLHNPYISHVSHCLQAYKAVNGRYTDNKTLLQLPPFIFSQRCIRDLGIELDWGGFRITAKSAEKSLQDGHTRTDRYVWFGDQKEQF